MSSDPARILVVEDEVLIGLMLVRKLRSYGYEVDDVVTTGEAAVRRVGEERPDAILMDVALAGDLNGIEAARIIKKQYDVPIIIFSGYDDKSFNSQIQSIAPVAVLKKMDPVSDIVAAIERAVHGDRAGKTS
jgi:CheY-like chemotaxis protein